MVIRKWNENKKDYDVVTIPDEWNVPIFTNNMDEIVNCVNCGCKMKFGEGYTSKRYYNKTGASYSECKKCFDEYLPTYFKSRRDKSKDEKKAKITDELSSIVKEFMLKVSDVAYKHDVEAAPLIRSAACIIITESDKVEMKARKLEKLLKEKDKMEDILKALEGLLGDG